MSQINGSEGITNERTSERLDWCTDVTDELGWQTATRRKPRNQTAPGSGLRPTAVSFEPSSIGASTPSRSGYPHNSQPFLKGLQNTRKGFHNRYEKPSSITEFDGNVESRQGNIRGQRQIRDDTKFLNTANGTANTGYKKAPKTTKNNEIVHGNTASRQDWSRVRTQETEITTGPEQMKKSEQPPATICPGSKKEEIPAQPVPSSQQPGATATGKKSKKSKKNAGKKASLKVDKAALDAEESAKTDKGVVNQCKETVQDCLEEEEEKLPDQSKVFQPDSALRFGDASQIASVIRLPKNRSDLRKSKLSRGRQDFPSKQKAARLSRPIRLPLTMPAFSWSRRSRELAPTFAGFTLDDDEQEFHSMAPTADELLPRHKDSHSPEISTGSAPLNPAAPEFSQECCQVANLSSVVPEHSQPEQQTLEESKVSHIPPPTDWPTFVPGSQNKTCCSPPEHKKEVLAGQEHQKSGGEAQNFADAGMPDTGPCTIDLQRSDSNSAIKAQEDSAEALGLGQNLLKTPDQNENSSLVAKQRSSYPAPTLEDLKNSGGLIEALPQHCQPVYSAGNYPSEPPSRLADGYMYCEDQIDRRYYASGAFVEPTLEQLLFPKSYSVGQYALAIVLVKQIAVCYVLLGSIFHQLTNL